MYVRNAYEIWRQLEQRYSVTNGSRKYRLTKEIYDMKQKGRNISAYYTDMRALWEELEDMNDLPLITAMTAEVRRYVETIKQQQEEQRLFQFLNGLDEEYGALRSQLLMWYPLPNVDVACSFLQQEESQRKILKPIKEEVDSLAMMSKTEEGKGQAITCSACGKPGHSKEECWTIVGYPPYHPKAQGQKDAKGKGAYQNVRGGRGGRWTRGGRTGRGGARTSGGRFAGSAQGKWEVNDTGTSSKRGEGITMQQLEQILKMLPLNTKPNEGECEDDMDVNLKNGMKVEKVKHVPKFKHNLLSVQKFAKETGYVVKFKPEYCVFEDPESGKIKGIGKARNGIYYLIEEEVKDVGDVVKVIKSVKEEQEELKGGRSAMNTNAQLKVPTEVNQGRKPSATTLWHQIPRHAPVKRLALINELGSVNKQEDQKCLICPLA
ncbi:Antiviral helicase SKI2, partial [Bienertia sinuspersici]